MTCKIQV